MKAMSVIICLILIFGCTLGPDYKRPTYPVPEEYRGESLSGTSHDQAPSFGDLKWFELFQDEKLQHLIKIALRENYDVRIAAQRIIAAREQVTIRRSFLFPSINANGEFESVRVSERGITPVAPGEDLEPSAGFIFGDLSWELDFFGRIRRATEAAQYDFLASEENRRFVIQTLVTELARAYFELLELDLELAISKRTVDSRRKSLNLVKARFDYGKDGLVPVRMAENLLYGATQIVPDLERLIEQKENQISTLLGQNPERIDRGMLLEQDLRVSIPPGLPSSLLERRPDIRAAEDRLAAANARVGEAKALLFPSISLTAAAGFESQSLRNLLTGSATFWDVVPSVTQPLFNAGRLRANLKAAEAEKEQAVLAYKQTIQQAFREVSDALVAVRKLREVRMEREKQLAAVQDQTRLSKLRYFGGVTSYLEVLDAERQLFKVELALAQAQRNELLAVVALYRALGGGWQVDG